MRIARHTIAHELIKALQLGQQLHARVRVRMSAQLNILLAEHKKSVMAHHCVPIVAALFEHLSAYGAVLAELANVAFFERAGVVAFVQDAVDYGRGQIGLFDLLVARFGDYVVGF